MLQKWFNHLNSKQLILVRVSAIIFGILLMLWGVGLLIIAVWLYLEFGKDKKPL